MAGLLIAFGSCLVSYNSIQNCTCGGAPRLSRMVKVAYMIYDRFNQPRCTFSRLETNYPMRQALPVLVVLQRLSGYGREGVLAVT
jgi:hypothetical protein